MTVDFALFINAHYGNIGNFVRFGSVSVDTRGFERSLIYRHVAVFRNVIVAAHHTFGVSDFHTLRNLNEKYESVVISLIFFVYRAELYEKLAFFKRKFIVGIRYYGR